jgi:phytoene/squalene synthetase
VTDENVAACAGIVYRADPERFRAAMAAPVAARRILFPLYAFNTEVARAPWLTQEPMIAEMRLQWWRDVLEEIASGGPVRRHEVATPLADVLDATGARLLDDLVETRRWDIHKDPFEDDAAFTAHIERSAGLLMWVAARALGEAPRDVAMDAGFAHGLANWLRAIPALEAARRVPLVDGRPEAIRSLAQEGLARLARARARRGEVSAAAAPAFLPAWKTAALLGRVWRDPGLVARGQVDVSPLRSRLTLLARAATGRW